MKLKHFATGLCLSCVAADTAAAHVGTDITKLPNHSLLLLVTITRCEKKKRNVPRE